MNTKAKPCAGSLCVLVGGGWGWEVERAGWVGCGVGRRLPHPAGLAEHRAEAPGQEASQGSSSGVGVFSYPWPTDVGHHFMGYAKQAGSKWPEHLLIWAVFQTIRCVNICVWCWS